MENNIKPITIGAGAGMIGRYLSAQMGDLAILQENIDHEQVYVIDNYRKSLPLISIAEPKNSPSGNFRYSNHHNKKQISEAKRKRKNKLQKQARKRNR